MNVRALPTRVDKTDVIQSIYLGWVRDLAAEAGYFAAVITYNRDKDGTGKPFEVHLLRALGLDRPWHRLESAYNLDASEARALFTEHESKAEWPETSST